jgi:hypothetical protein
VRRREKRLKHNGRGEMSCAGKRNVEDEKTNIEEKINDAEIMSTRKEKKRRGAGEIIMTIAVKLPRRIIASLPEIIAKLLQRIIIINLRVLRTTEGTLSASEIMAEKLPDTLLMSERRPNTLLMSERHPNTLLMSERRPNTFLT